MIAADTSRAYLRECGLSPCFCDVMSDQHADLEAAARATAAVTKAINAAIHDNDMARLEAIARGAVALARQVKTEEAKQEATR